MVYSKAGIYIKAFTSKRCWGLDRRRIVYSRILLRMGSPILHVYSERAIKIEGSLPMNKIVAQATRTRLGCLDLAAREAEKVEWGHIIVHHSVNSNIVHYSRGIFSEKRVSYTRQYTQGRDAPESLGGIIQGRRTRDNCWL